MACVEPETGMNLFSEDRQRRPELVKSKTVYRFDKHNKTDVETSPFKKTRKPTPSLFSKPLPVPPSGEEKFNHQKLKESLVNGKDTSQEQRVGDFIIKSCLGKGTFSKVCLAEHRVTKQKFALKFMKSNTAAKSVKHAIRVEREIKLLSLLYHPHIVRLYDVSQHPKYTMIVMEHVAGGELLNYIKKKGRLGDTEARKFFRQIISAVDYCHKNCIIHRDLKLENVMIDSDERLRIIDFGFANTFNPDKHLETFCGSPFYAAPEMVNGIRYVGPEVDIWSMGVILFFMLCGRTPFEGENLREIYEKISKGHFTLAPYLSRDAADILKKMLTVDPKHRATMEEIRSHPWVNHGFAEPPDNYLPPRLPVVPNPNTQTLQKMVLYGYKQDEAKLVLQRGDTALHPTICIYHLLEESRKRKIARQARKSLTSSSINQAKDSISSTPQSPRPVTSILSVHIPTSPSKVAPSTPSDPKKLQRNLSQREKEHRKRTSMNSEKDVDVQAAPMPFLEPSSRIFQFHNSQKEQTVSGEHSPVEEKKHQDKKGIPLANFSQNSSMFLDASTPHLTKKNEAGFIASRKSMPHIITKATSNASSFNIDFPKPVKDASAQNNFTKSFIRFQLAKKNPELSKSKANIRGFFNIKTTTTKLLPDIHDQFEKAFIGNGIAYTQMTDTSYLCEERSEKNGNRFEVLITRADHTPIYSIKFKRLRGTVWSHRKLSHKLIQDMEL